MADENQDREENQKVIENVNIPEAENKPKYVNVTENVAEADNLALGSSMSETWLEKEAHGMLTGILEIWPTRMELKENYWKGIDDDMSEGPEFVMLKDFVGKEDRVEPSSKQLHKKK
ncbi:hypothetical protein QYF36_025916 [Acer negundo]|nr:hypothetical protein QYF36_025916 [Acer negundo]